jgi:hypothetical protein
MSGPKKSWSFKIIIETVLSEEDQADETPER